MDVKRVYDWDGRGRAVLVDRVWPRGIRKDRLQGTGWLRDVAPSDELRRWFRHRPERWEEFRRRYRDELAEPARAGVAEGLLDLARQGPITLLFGARDERHNQAVVLRDWVEERLG